MLLTAFGLKISEAHVAAGSVSIRSDVFRHWLIHSQGSSSAALQGVCLLTCTCCECDGLDNYYWLPFSLFIYLILSCLLPYSPAMG